MRETTTIDQIAEKYVKDLVELEPSLGTSIGIPGYEERLEVCDLAWHEQSKELESRTLRELEQAEVTDDVDRVTKLAMQDRLELNIRAYAAETHLNDLNNIASPVQSLREIFDLMPQESLADWQAIIARLGQYPAALAGYQECLAVGLAKGVVPAQRQVIEVIRQVRELASKRSFFLELLAKAQPVITESLAAEMRQRVEKILTAHAELLEFLENQLLPKAALEDAVGRDRYQIYSELFLGAKVDLEESYQWGLELVSQIAEEQRKLAAKIVGPGATVRQAAAALDADPARQLRGAAELVAWMSEVSQQAIRDLDGKYFDIDPKLHNLSCNIAPPAAGGIYYTPPNLDFSRPGQMWWSIPEGIDTFTTWQEKTTVYHEGVPGHHMQCGQAVLRQDQLNTWRSAVCWISGHGEGWALYAESLMAELGYLSDLGDRFGMLDAQQLRAARVVVDIGLHLGLKSPYGGIWTADDTWRYLNEYVMMPEPSLRFEWLRYLGWPGQAPSYQIGQRLWQELRTAALAQGYSLKDFHMKALNLGTVPMSVLAEEILKSSQE